MTRRKRRLFGFVLVEKFVIQGPAQNKFVLPVVARHKGLYLQKTYKTGRFL